VSPQQNKPILLVDIGHVIDDPGTRIVAAGTVRTYRLLVHIGMTADAVQGRLIENKGSVAQPAVYGLVGT
jgi:hypothetical protein